MTDCLLPIGVAAYRHVIDREVIEQISDLLSAVPAREVSQALHAQSRSLLALRGLGREIWKGVDALDYVRELRGEWDR